MAKSLRSKWKRKCRAIKRERYGAKELERLKKVLGVDENASTEVEMADISNVATVVDAKKVKKDAKSKKSEDAQVDSAAAGEEMEVDDAAASRKESLRNKSGSYPVWMSQRKIKKYIKGRGRSTKKATRKTTGKRLTRRQKKMKKQQN